MSTIKLGEYAKIKEVSHFSCKNVDHYKAPGQFLAISLKVSAGKWRKPKVVDLYLTHDELDELLRVLKQRK